MKIKTRDMILVSFFSALMVVGAFVKIPFPVLPITLQPFFCALAGIILGSRLGVLSQIVYVIFGLAGAPVFTEGGGITYVLNPKFGYLLGFIAAVWVIGKMSEILKGINMKNTLISVMAGLIALYAIGIPYMFFILKFYLNKQEITLWYILTTNIPYMIKDVALYAIIASTAASMLPVLKKHIFTANKAF
jgi:biotin transport system substrate-specific component